MKRTTFIISICIALLIPTLALAAPGGGGKPPKTVDADTLDGLDSSDFALSSHSHSAIKTGHLSIPASAFKLADSFNLYNYVSYHSVLRLHEDLAAYFNAPVYLPDGTTINNITMYWKDCDPLHDLQLSLLSWDYQGRHGYEHVRFFSYGNAGSGSSSASSIDIPIVDNMNRAYSIQLFMYGDPAACVMEFHGVVIEYEQ